MHAKILIVEDEAITALDIQGLLKDMDFEVVSTASTGMEAIQKAEDLKPDLILMDITLKGEIDGIEAAKKITALFNIPVIYLTGYSDQKTFERIKLTQPYGFVSKPISYDELKLSIETALYKHKLDKKLKKSEEKYRGWFEDDLTGDFIATPEGELLDCNPSFLEMYGFNNGEKVIHSNISKFNPEGWIDLIAILKEEKKVKNRQTWLTRPNGKRFHVVANVVGIFNDLGKLVQVKGYVFDDTERKKAEENLHKEVERESFFLELYKNSPQLTDKELYSYSLDHAVRFTDSAIGFFHLISDDQKTVILDTWNNETFKTCKTSFKTHYPIEQAGNWTDCIKVKGPVVYNDFKNSPNRKGFPEGHVSVKRFISVPVFDGDKAKFIFGVGNKIEEYDDHDVIQIQSVANELYKIIKRRQGEQELKEARDNLEKQVKERTAELKNAFESVKREAFAASQNAKALKESEAKFRELFNKALDMITLSESRRDGLFGNFIGVNDAAVNILGYTREEFLNKTPLDLFAPTSKEELPKFMVKLQKKKYITFESVTITKNGKQIPVEVSVHTFKLGEKMVSLAIARDITERKKSEEELKESEAKYRELFDKSTDMISLSEINEDSLPGKYIELNEVGLKRLGYTKEEILNMTPADIIAPDKKVEMPKNAVEIAEKGLSSFEMVHVTKEGKQIPVEVNCHIINYQGRKVYLTVSRDITERKDAENKLKSMLKKLERSNEELQRFAYVASHDLQEPLRTISSFTQLLERRYKEQLDSDADEFMGYVVEASQRMQRMILDLLEYSRVSTKDEEFKLVNSEIILNRVIDGLKNLIEETGAKITHDPLPAVMADENQLYRVFQNIIANAIKFRKENETPEIHISAYINNNKNEYIFSFSDNGIGIETQYFDRIFTIFQRLHTVEEYTGSGIGLSISKKIIECHGGQMWVESEFGKGSIFYFTLPKS
ncbi:MULTISPECIES: PAS domain S-box protein [Methanobacterium]|jgi:PAS domain S-box-containing protein|uniref:histidine kinase n=1 Tax=Methanobacterium veterum TaxID=408577 RepID=A0A9E5A616_9EURY|nr:MULTISPECIES: PAS domain S-box protein [Methanobacterium]MCZ3366969.1 PAS domain S-box protein [Methanobacterium veterum]MCZ3373884.1 PAS domain S-box protein [Methanobacterium veterum]